MECNVKFYKGVIMIYFDNGSTTPVDERVKNKVVEYLNNNFGNPSSLHKLGVEAEKRIKNEREKVAKYLGVHSKNIVFTSGGTESNNYAIKGSCYTFQNRGKHIITTIFEHASVYYTFKSLEAEGFEVEYINVDSNGFVNIEELKSKIRKDTILISIMHTNNEIGSIQNLEAIGKGIKEVKLYTAAPFDEQQSEALLQFLKNQFKAPIELSVKVKPDLLGGFILTVDGKMADASMSTKLKEIKKQLLS